MFSNYFILAFAINLVKINKHCIYLFISEVERCVAFNQKEQKFIVINNKISHFTHLNLIQPLLTDNS